MNLCTKRFSILFVVLLLVGAFASEGSAQGLGQEWESLTENQTRIVFKIPDFNGIARFLKTQSSKHSYTLEYGIWKTTAARHPKAMIAYWSLSPNYVFRAGHDPRLFVEESEIFDGKKIEFDSIHRSTNKLGVIQYRRFAFDLVNCAVFVEIWGYAEGGFYVEGIEQLRGYYCADPGKPLSEETLSLVLAGINIKDEEAVQQEALLSPAKAPPVKPLYVVEAYLDNNSKEIDRNLSDYNRKHEALVGANAGASIVKAIHSKIIKNLDGDSVFLEISFMVGNVGTGSNNWSPVSGTVLFELKWVNDRLEFVGHKKM